MVGIRDRRDKSEIPVFGEVSGPRRSLVLNGPLVERFDMFGHHTINLI